MVPCVVLGDSIAVGIGLYRPECETVAKVGITSARYIDTLLVHHTAGAAIISLGVNDDQTVPTLADLRRVRAEVTARQVVWIIPNVKDFARNAVRQVALENGDATLDLRRYAGFIAPDHVHPTGRGYLLIAGNLRAATTMGAPPVEVAEAEPEPARPVYRLDHGQPPRTIAGLGRLSPARTAYERRVIAHMSATRLAHAEALWREGSGWRLQPASLHTLPVVHTASRSAAEGGALLPLPPVPPQLASIAPPTGAAIAPRRPPRATIYRTLRETKAKQQPAS